MFSGEDACFDDFGLGEDWERDHDGFDIIAGEEGGEGGGGILVFGVEGDFGAAGVGGDEGEGV